MADSRDTPLAEQATAARYDLRSELAAIEAPAGDRDAIAPTVAAIDTALDSVVSIAEGLDPRCDVVRLVSERAEG